MLQVDELPVSRAQRSSSLLFSAPRPAFLPGAELCSPHSSLSPTDPFSGVSLLVARWSRRRSLSYTPSSACPRDHTAAPPAFRCLRSPPHRLPPASLSPPLAGPPHSHCLAESRRRRRRTPTGRAGGVTLLPHVADARGQEVAGAGGGPARG